MKTIYWLVLGFSIISVIATPVQAQQPLPPVVTVQVLNAIAAEGVDEPAVAIVHRNRGLQKPLRVFYALKGAAKNGVDYERLSGSVIIPAGSREAAVEIRAIDDDLVEGNERVAFCLKPPSNPRQYRLGAASRGLMEIADNDEAPVEEPPVDESTVVPFLAFQYGPPGFGSVVGRLIRVPPLNYVYRAPANVVLVANTDYIVSVEFFVSANFLGSGSSSLGVITEAVPGNRPVANTFSFNWSNVPAGTYTLTAKGVATTGQEIVGGPLTLTVQP